MINIQYIPELLEKTGIITIEVKSIEGYRLFEIIEDDPKHCVRRWNELLPFISDHKKLILTVGDIKMQRGGGKAKLQWLVFLDGPKKEETKNNPQQMSGMNQAINMQTYLDSKIKELEQAYEIKNLKEQLGKKNEDSGGLQWMGFLERMINKDATANNLNGPATLAGTQAEEMEKVMESICNKVPIEKIMRLLRAINKNPALVDQALKFI